MKISSNFDPERNVITFNVTSTLLKKYYYNLSGMLKADEGVSSIKNIEMSKTGLDTASITLPIDGTSGIQTSQPRPGIMAVAVEKDLLTKVTDVLNRFVNLAINKELITKEFCPLFGYNFANLREDLKLAIKSKRDLIFIDTYENYLNECKNNTYHFNQYVIEYGTSEWADAIILIEKDRIDELEKWIKPLLKETYWY